MDYNNFVISTSDFNEANSLPRSKIARGPFGSLPIESMGGGYVDAWRSKRNPTERNLANEYKRIAYACANINATAVANTPLKLYVKTDKGQRKARCLTKKISKSKADYLSSLPFLQKQLRSFVEVEEVVSHPALDLLDRVNPLPWIHSEWLKVQSQLYQEITGKCYWLVIKNPVLNIPTEIWILPSQNTKPKSEPESRNIIDYYLYQAGGLDEKKYSTDQIIPFFMPNLENPYADGMSPLAASWESNEVAGKLIAHENSFLDNEARPDVVLSPKDKDQALYHDDAKSWAREYSKAFSRQRTGGVFVPEEAVDITPITYPPRDLARLEIHKWSKEEICNSYDIPTALLEHTNINRATLEAARQQHALNGVLPRTNRNASNLNASYIPYWDDSGRLFFAYDDPVPELREIKMQENVQFVMNGIKTPNEARAEYDMPPHPDGDELRAINVSPEMMRQNERDSGTAKR